MKKALFFATAIALTFVACQSETTPSGSVTQTPAPEINTPSVNGLNLKTEDNAELQSGGLRLYPITADDQVLAANAHFANWKTMDEAMKIPGFRITEQKQFGRDGNAWYNGLTVQNKTNDTIFIMSGDVVRGGNQDRVNEVDLAMMPASLRNISVFCVEHGRSSYYNPEAPQAEKEAGAFKDYYAVASPRVRMAINDGNQQGVWEAVDVVTKANQAESHTDAYAALENESAVKANRDALLRFFEGKLNDKNVVGMVAVLNGEVIGVEIFAHPKMFQRRYPALIHSYAVEAAASEHREATGKKVTTRFAEVAALASPTRAANDNAGKFAFDGKWVHLYGR